MGGTEIAVLEPRVAVERGIGSATSEVAQAVSVAAAYFEDTLETTPAGLLVTGTMGAEALAAVLESAGVGPVRVEELVSPEMLGPGATTASSAGRVPHGLAGGSAGGVERLMRISINLATRPFAELRPLFARLRLAMAGLALLAIGLGVGLHFLSVRAKAAEARMDALKAQTLAIQTERQTNERRMQEKQNRAVLERSKFLNTLFVHKSFSWTSVMMDLEGVLPGGVEVTSIDPTVTAEGDVNIRLRVSGEREPAVDLVRRLERSQRFLQPRLTNETAQTQEGKSVAVSAPVGAAGGVEFEIVSGYNPLPATLKVPAKDEVKAGGAASGKVAKLSAPKAASKPADKKAGVKRAPGAKKAEGAGPVVAPATQKGGAR